jgi:uncharacterized RDD family membrane protein YckC
METDGTRRDDAAGTYTSEEAKRTYLRSVWRWGIVFIIAQIVMPMAFTGSFVILMNVVFAGARDRSTVLYAVIAFAAVLHFLGYVIPLVFAGVVSKKAAAAGKGRVMLQGSHAVLAPVWKRAKAQMLDAVLVAVPAVLISAQLGPKFFDMPKENAFEYFMYLLIELGLRLSLWMVGSLLLFSLLEGVYGATPGKFVQGVRVAGTDLRPCGFWRALLRNLFKIVDGLLNFMLGIFVAALGEKNQRIGDRVAGTVVIEAGTPPSGGSV